MQIWKADHDALEYLFENLEVSMNRGLGLAFALVTLVGSVFAAGGSHAPKKKENIKGKQLFETCTACHGPKGLGNPAIKAPSIAGLEQWYLEAQLRKFKNGARGAHPEDVTGLLMRPMARTLHSEEDIKAVAEYVSKMAYKKAKVTVEGDKDKGKAAFAVCSACHGPAAEGNKTMNAPSLTKLSDWYIVSQLDKFKKGVRGNNAKDTTGMQMRPMAVALNEGQMKDIAAYVASLSKDVAAKKETKKTEKAHH